MCPHIPGHHSYPHFTVIHLGQPLQSCKIYIFIIPVREDDDTDAAIKDDNDECLACVQVQGNDTTETVVVSPVMTVVPVQVLPSTIWCPQPPPPHKLTMENRSIKIFKLQSSVRDCADQKDQKKTISGFYDLSDIYSFPSFA